jgi:hypothetical protein
LASEPELEAPIDAPPVPEAELDPQPEPEPEPKPEPEPDTPPQADLLDKLRIVNTSDEAAALAIAERHALLDDLRANASTATLIDETANYLLDLSQAADAAQPCETFATALDALAHERDARVRKAIRRASAPKGGGAACSRARRSLERLQTGKNKPASAPVPEPEPSEPRPGEITPKLGGLD